MNYYFDSIKLEMDAMKMPTKSNYISAWMISWIVASIIGYITFWIAFFALTFIGPFLSWFPGYRGSGGLQLGIALATVASGFASYKTIVAMYRHRYPKLNYKKVVPWVMVLGLGTALINLLVGLSQNDFLVLQALMSALLMLFFVGQLTEMEEAKSN